MNRNLTDFDLKKRNKNDIKIYGDSKARRSVKTNPHGYRL